MANQTYVGNAVSVAQVDIGTVTGSSSTGGHILTIKSLDENGTDHSIVETVAAAGIASSTAASNIVTTWNASGDPVISRVTASASGAIVSLTADTAGVPMTTSWTFVTTTGATSGSWGTQGTSVSNSGPNDFNTAANWDTLSVPASTDNIFLPPGSESILYGLNQSTKNFGKFIVQPGYTYDIGGTDGGYLRCAPATGADFKLAGTGTAYIDVGASDIDPLIEKAGPSATGTYGLYLKGTAMSHIYIEGGKVGIGVDGDDTTTEVDNVLIGTASGASPITVVVGEGVTGTAGGAIAVVRKSSGTFISRTDAAITALTNDGGDVQTEGTGTITTLNLNSGSAILESTGTITTLNIKGGEANFLGSQASHTVTTVKLEADGALAYDPNVLTITNKVASDDRVRLTATQV